MIFSLHVVYYDSSVFKTFLDIWCRYILSLYQLVEVMGVIVLLLSWNHQLQSAAAFLHLSIRFALNKGGPSTPFAVQRLRRY